MPSSEQELAALQEAWEKLRAEDSMAVCAEFEAIADPEQTARIYAKFANWLYNEKREIAWMIAFSRAGIQFCLREAARLEKSDPERSLKLKGLAKGISYNLGTNLWPGWDDPGVRLIPRGDSPGARRILIGVEWKSPVVPADSRRFFAGTLSGRICPSLVSGTCCSAVADKSGRSRIPWNQGLRARSSAG